MLLAVVMVIRDNNEGRENNGNHSPSESQIQSRLQSSPTPTPLAAPSSLSPKENLEAGKKALSQGDLSTARNHLSGIPKGSQEYASANQFLAKVEASEQRKKIEDELKDIRSQIARQEDIMNRTKSMEGSIGKNLYANAL